MFNLNLFGSLQQSGDIPDAPRLIDFMSYEPQNDHSLFFNYSLPQDEPILNQQPQQNESPQIVPPRPSFSLPFLQTFTFSRPPPYNFTMNPEQRQIIPKVVKNKRKSIPTRKITQTTQCPICLLDIKKNSKIPQLGCDHEFHKKCLLKWMQKQENCPLCRLDLSCNNQ